MKYTILWSAGTVENPDDGEYEIEAKDVHEALELFEAKKGWRRNVEAVVRSDIWLDIK